MRIQAAAVVVALVLAPTAAIADPPGVPAPAPPPLAAPTGPAPSGASAASLPTDLSDRAGVVFMRRSGFTPLRFYPERAQREKIEGETRVRCLIDSAGVLTRCAIISETPPGYGFGAAELKIVSMYLRVRPTTRSGEPTAGRTIVIPFHFKLPPSG